MRSLFATVLGLLLASATYAGPFVFRFQRGPDDWKVTKDGRAVCTQHGSFELSWQPTEAELDDMHGQLWLAWRTQPGYRLENAWMTVGGNKVHWHVREVEILSGQ